jgi:putative membrane protein
MVLLGVFAVIFIALGISPTSREDWLLENMLVFAALALLIGTAPRFRFSNSSYTCLFVFLVLHEIGAHYTYSEVPYERWIAGAHGVTLEALLGSERNAYDRVLHLGYGLLMFLPTLELMRAVAPPRGWWRFAQVPAVILAGSALYELIEFAAALVFGGELGEAYLGTQGDTWDAQKDMLCALGGALIAELALLAGSSASLRR